jgi:hypothetical protein
MDIICNCKDGRIEGICRALILKYGKPISSLGTMEKLEALCESLLLSITELDELISSNSQSLRAVKGLCFESALQYILIQNGYEPKDVGGDSPVDLIVNGHSLQLKTPYKSGTTDLVVEYKTHKTHGSKSNKESIIYYHSIVEFADFFVGLISYNPFKVFIVPKEQLPRRSEDNNYIESPFKLFIYSIFDRGYSSFVNNFESLGININVDSIEDIFPNDNELLPRTAKAIGLNTDIIVDTILKKENFMAWDMNIRGFAREYVLKKILTLIGKKYVNVKKQSKRSEKADLSIYVDNDKPSKVQVKGLSVTKCNFDGVNSELVVETQLTRGHINDHPTQSRLYQWDDFEYLVLGIDPAITYTVFGKACWHFYLIPSSVLTRHYRFSNRYNDKQSFIAKELEKYLFWTYG